MNKNKKRTTNNNLKKIKNLSPSIHLGAYLKIIEITNLIKRFSINSGIHNLPFSLP